MTTNNRQTERTRGAIRTAFSELVFSCRYDEIRMIDVARKANIGRSTLYSHYHDKDSILLDSMAPLLASLATAIQGEVAQADIEAALSHIWSNRDRGRVVLFGVTGQKLEAAFAQYLAEKQDIGPMTGARPFIVNPISALIFAILRTWLKGEASGAIPDIAHHICTLSRATLDASRLSEWQK